MKSIFLIVAVICQDSVNLPNMDQFEGSGITNDQMSTDLSTEKKGNVVSRVIEGVGKFATDSVGGIFHAIAHPLDTAEQVTNMVIHPIQSGGHILSDIQNYCQKDTAGCIGYTTALLGTLFIPFGGAANIGAKSAIAEQKVSTLMMNSMDEIAASSKLTASKGSVAAADANIAGKGVNIVDDANLAGKGTNIVEDGNVAGKGTSAVEDARGASAVEDANVAGDAVKVSVTQDLHFVKLTEDWKTELFSKMKASTGITAKSINTMAYSMAFLISTIARFTQYLIRLPSNLIVKGKPLLEDARRAVGEAGSASVRAVQGSMKEVKANGFFETAHLKTKAFTDYVKGGFKAENIKMFAQTKTGKVGFTGTGTAAVGEPLAAAQDIASDVKLKQD